MQNRKKVPAGYYGAGEAISVIGIPTSSFYNLVRSGKIKGVILPGRKEAYYPKHEIDRYARAMKTYIEQFSTDKSYFGIALSEDIPDIIDLVAAACGGYEHTIPREILEVWLRKSPESIHVLRKGTEIIGYCSMFPLPVGTIMRRMTGELWNRTLPIDDIQAFIPGDPLKLYVAEVVVKPLREGDTTPNRYLGARLFSEIFDHLADLAKQGITFDEIYAVGTTPFGIEACRSLGMTPLDLAQGVRENRIPFMVEVESGVSHFIERYRNTVKQLQRTH
jgi:hypothetical protein